jgi:hypothetical protein
MTKSATEFADLLTAAVRTIKANEDKNLDLIQDELGYELGKEGASYINYLRRGNIPSDPRTVEALARGLAARGGLDRASCARLLRSAGHGAPDAFTQTVFSTTHAAPAPFLREDVVFVAGPPITKPHQFFGRERALRRISTWWKNFPMSHVALIGPKRAGKTSLTHYLQRINRMPQSALRPGQKNDWLPQARHYRWVRVDFQDARMCKLDNLLRHILTELALPIPSQCDLDRFLDVVTDQHHWQRPTIIIMDDIDQGLASRDLDRAFWQSLRSLVDSAVEGNLAFLVTSQEDPARLADDASKTSPFFTIFNTEHLGPFTESEARELIASAPMPFAEAEVEWILARSGLWPALLQILCQERLMGFEEGDASEAWQVDAQRRCAAYPHLFEAVAGK